MALTVIPYAEINGEWTIPDETMASLYGLMEKEGTAKTVFYSGTVQSAEDFIRASRPPSSNTVIILTEDGEPAAVGWLNNFGIGSAHAHWVCFSNIWGLRTDEAIQAALKYWFHFKADGKPLFDILLGIFPEDNRAIRMFARRAGFTVIGVIPGLIYNYWENRRIGAVFSYIERGTVCHS